MPSLGDRVKAAAPVSLVLLLALLLIPCLSPGQTFDNAGFKKNVPPELRQKFPMCDEFLDPEWIDPGRYIGRIEMDLYSGGVPVEGGSRDSLFFSKRPGPYPSEAGTYFVTFLLESDESDDPGFNELVRKAWFGGARGVLDIHTDPKEDFDKGIEGKEKKISFDMDFESNGVMYTGDDRHTLSNFTKNVCLLLPKEEEVFVIEGKIPFRFKKLTGKTRERYDAILRECRRLCNAYIGTHRQYASCDLSWAPYGASIDVNFDGIEDYVARVFFNKKKGGKDTKLFVLSPDGRGGYKGSIGPEECVYGDQETSATAAEKKLFFNGCNLTDMAGGGPGHGRN